jgi:transposase-like protein
MHGWLKQYREQPAMPFAGSGKLRPDDEHLKKLERQVRELREENEIFAMFNFNQLMLIRIFCALVQWALLLCTLSVFA